MAERDDWPAVSIAKREAELLDLIERCQPIDEVLRAYALWVTARVDNNKSRAARILGVDRRTLQRWDRKAT